MAKSRTRGRSAVKNAAPNRPAPLSEPAPDVIVPLAPTTGKQAIRLAIATLAVLAWLGFLAFLALRHQ
jgi:hypothetical protein